MAPTPWFHVSICSINWHWKHGAVQWMSTTERSCHVHSIRKHNTKTKEGQKTHVLTKNICSMMQEQQRGELEIYHSTPKWYRYSPTFSLGKVFGWRRLITYQFYMYMCNRWCKVWQSCFLYPDRLAVTAIVSSLSYSLCPHRSAVTAPLNFHFRSLCPHRLTVSTPLQLYLTPCPHIPTAPSILSLSLSVPHRPDGWPFLLVLFRNSS